MNRRKLTLVAVVVAGSLVILGAIVGYIVVLVNSAPQASPAPRPSTSTTPAGTPSTAPSNGAVVDPSAAELGLVPEPITEDIDVYADAALRMPWTYDTTKVSLDQFKDAIRPWFTGDPGFTSAADAEVARKGKILALFQSDFFPSYQTWDALTSTKARSTAELAGPITYENVFDDATGNMRVATGQLKVTVTQDDGGTAPATMESVIEAKVSILCDPSTQPAPNSAQKPGDCKVITYIPTVTTVTGGGDD